MGASLQQARDAKPLAYAAVANLVEVVGVGISGAGDDYSIKINLAHAPEPSVDLPASIDGVRIVYDVVGRIVPRL